MATLDEIIPEQKALAQLRLPDIVGEHEVERIISVRRAAVRALEDRAGVYLRTRQVTKTGYFVPGDDCPMTANLRHFIVDIESVSYQASDGSVVDLDKADVKLYERIEHGMRVLKLMPVERWPAVANLKGRNLVLINVTLNVGATIEQVTEILQDGWETYLNLMLGGYYDSRYMSGMEVGVPLDHSTAEREALRLKPPMAT